MKAVLKVAFATALILAGAHAHAQNAVLQAGPWLQGDLLEYANPGGSQPTVKDSGIQAITSVPPVIPNSVLVSNATTPIWASTLPSGLTIPTPAFIGLQNGNNLPLGAIIGFGSNVEAALATPVGNAGSIVINGGALGEPSSGNATLLTNLQAAALVGNLNIGNFNSGSGASGSTFWRGDGTWATAGNVTSVNAAGSGIFSFTGGPITGAGTLTLGVAGTSGGVPYFSNGTTLSSSGVLAANMPVIGGGTGGSLGVGTISGSGTIFATVSGIFTPGDCVSVVSAGGGVNFIDAGGPCTTGGASGSVTAGTTGQLAKYTGTTAVGSFALGGDCTFSGTSITCTKSNGVSLSLGGTLTTAAALTTTGAGAPTLAFPGSSFTYTHPANSGTLAEVGFAQTWTAAQTFTNSDLLLLGSSTGATTFTSANSSATNYTLTLPAATDTIADLAGAQTFTNKTLTAPTLTSPTVTGAFTATGLVTNADLANSATTVNGQTCTLGSTCTISAAASLVVGSTAITSGTTGYYLYDNGGTLGNLQPNAANGPVQLNGSGYIPFLQSVGVTSGGTPSAGNVGQVISSDVPSGSAVNLTSATATNITSVSLTAGAWLCFGNVQTTSVAQLYGQFYGWISTTSITLPTNLEQAGTFNAWPDESLGTGANPGENAGPVVFNFSAASTPVYLSTSLFYGGGSGTPKGYGLLLCFRFR